MLYAADGSLLQRKYIKDGVEVSKTDYLRGKELKNGLMESVYHNDGRVIKSGANWKYEYQIKDHLGNVRDTFEDANNDGYADRKSLNDYYSFGMEWNNKWELGDTISPENKYRYNGKEFVGEMELDQYFYGARTYDAKIGRWGQIDKLAFKYKDNSTYNFVANMPITAFDPDGNQIAIVGDATYKTTILKSLINLAFNSDAGFALVKNAISSTRLLVIGNTRGDLGNFVTNWSDKYSFMAFNLDVAKQPLDKTNGRDGKPLEKTIESSLAHELAHFESGVEANKFIVDRKGYSTGILSDEPYATKMENRVRRDLGMNERTHYGGLRVYGKRFNNGSLVDDGKDNYQNSNNSNAAYYYIFNQIESKNEPLKNYNINGRSLRELFNGQLPTSQLVLKTKIK